MATNIIRGEHDNEHPFRPIQNAAAQNKQLSFEARGALWYLLSKPDDWEIQPADLEQQCSKHVAYRIIKELMTARHMVRITRRNAKRRVIKVYYQVYEKQLPENQEVDLQEIELLETEKLLPENSDITKYRVLQTKESTNKREKEGSARGATPPKPTRPSQPKPTKPKTEDPPLAVEVGSVIKAWLDATGSMDNKAYGKTGYRSVAESIVEAGYVPKDITDYVMHLKTNDKYFRDKNPTLGYIQNNISAWRKPGNSAKPTVRASLLTPMPNIQPRLGMPRDTKDEVLT